MKDLFTPLLYSSNNAYPTDPFSIYHFCFVSPLALLYRDSASGLLAILVLSLIFWVTCY